MIIFTRILVPTRSERDKFKARNSNIKTMLFVFNMLRYRYTKYASRFLTDYLIFWYAFLFCRITHYGFRITLFLMFKACPVKEYYFIGVET